MRNVNFVANHGDIMDTFKIISKIKKDLEYLLNYYCQDDEELSMRLVADLKFINEFNTKYPSPYDVSKNILNELLLPKNVEYIHVHGRYPVGASPSNDLLIEYIRTIFTMEEYYHGVVANIWKSTLTDFDSFKNGDPFAFVAHSGSGSIPIILPGSQGYRDNDYNNTSYISASLFTNQLMAPFSSKLVLSFEVDKDSLICASDFDCVTHTGSYTDKANVVKVVNGTPISAGYTHSENVVSRVTTPLSMLEINIPKSIAQNGEILNYDMNKVYNEVVLDKTTARPVGILLLSNGCDFLLGEYLSALDMGKRYGLKTKVANKGTYRMQEGLPPFTKDELAAFERDLESYSSPNHPILEIDGIDNIIDSYIENIVAPANYVEDVQAKILETLEIIKNNRKRKNCMI